MKEQKLNPYEQVILSEMQRRANEGDTLLKESLDSKDKDIHGCFSYVKHQAQKKAVGGCAMIEDDVVFGWAHHYYIEPKDVIDAEMKVATKKEDKTDSSKVTPKVAKKNRAENRDKVTTVKNGGQTFTITEFSLF